MADVDSMLAALRAATGRRHAALDRRLRLAHDPSPRDVRVYLKAMLAFLEPVEAELWGRPSVAHLEPERRRAKARWLRADLARLGSAASDAPPSVFPSSPLGPAGWLGVAYVLEGATLGGRVLSRRPPLTGLRFFEGYGGETARLWRALVAELERVGGDSRRRASVVDGAVRAFAAVTEWLEGWGALRSPSPSVEAQP